MKKQRDGDDDNDNDDDDDGGGDGDGDDVAFFAQLKMHSSGYADMFLKKVVM